MHGPFHAAMVVLDSMQSDVTGDGILDTVYLLGRRPEGSSELFADRITLVIEDGYTNYRTAVKLPSGAGYNARLFLGDFDQDRIADIWIGIDSGGSGGYGIFYVYSFRHSLLRQLFDFESYNAEYAFRVNYEDGYKVNVASPRLGVQFMIDISTKSADYLSQMYDGHGKLKMPVQGEALAIGALQPIVTNEKSLSYDLLAFQRIIGTTNADTLGYVENLLSWKGQSFLSTALSVSVPGTKLKHRVGDGPPDGTADRNDEIYRSVHL